MRISGLQIKNVGVFDDLDIIFEEQKNDDLAEIHIFTGENGTGKSTILYALVGGILSEQEHLHGPYILNKNNLIKNRFRVEKEENWISVKYNTSGIFFVQYSGGKGFMGFGDSSGHLSNDAGSVFFVYNKAVDEYTNSLSILRGKFPFAAFAYSGSRNLSSVAIDSIKEFSLNPFENSLSFEKTISSEVITTWIANTKAKQSLLIVEGNTEKAGIIGQTIKRIESAVSEIIGSEIQFIMKSDPFEVKIKYNNTELEFTVLPDGLKSILSWISDLLIRLDRIPWMTEGDILDKIFILFLDEIEIHLHPAWQRKVLPVIQKLFKNAQIFVSSHSPFVVNSISGAWVHKLALNQEGASELVETVPSKAGSSYSLVLDEVFGMNEWFDIETEKELRRFYQLKDEYLASKNDSEKVQVVLEAAERLSAKSIELKNLIGTELRQLSRITGEDLSI